MFLRNHTTQRRVQPQVWTSLTWWSTDFSGYINKKHQLKLQPATETLAKIGHLGVWQEYYLVDVAHEVWEEQERFRQVICSIPCRKNMASSVLIRSIKRDVLKFVWCNWTLRWPKFRRWWWRWWSLGEELGGVVVDGTSDAADLDALLVLAVPWDNAQTVMLQSVSVQQNRVLVNCYVLL